MFDLGIQELIVIFIVALLVFGPKRLPELGRTLGKGMAELKKAMHGVKDQMDAEMREINSPLSFEPPKHYTPTQEHTEAIVEEVEPWPRPETPYTPHTLHAAETPIAQHEGEGPVAPTGNSSAEEPGAAPEEGKEPRQGTA